MIISTIIPAYNQARHLRRAVESLLACDYDNDKYEIILVDDASTDETWEVMRELEAIGRERSGGNGPDGKAGRGQVVCLRHERNANAAAARNTGILHCRQDVDVLAFIDQDCVVPENWLRTIAAFFRENPEVDYTGGPVLNRARNIWQEWAKYMSHQICDHEDFQTQLIGTNMAFRNKIFWDNFFDESIGYGTDETEFVFRLRVKGYTFKLCQDLIVYHYHRDNLSDLLRQRWRYGVGEARFYWKYGFGIYHPINTFMLKTHLSMLGALVAGGLGYRFPATILLALWLHYVIKYSRIRYNSFLKGEDIAGWKIPVFIGINWMVDTVVLLAKLRTGNPI